MNLVEEYARDRSRLGPPGERTFSGAAGGAPCGDLVRVSVRVADAALAEVTFDAEGCATARAAAAAVAELADGASFLDAARVSPADVSEALGGLGPPGAHAAELAADALSRALGQAAGSGAALFGPPQGERVAVAISGGVDSAVAALLERERGAEVVAITVKLWADSHNDGAKSCCSPQAVLGARALAHSLGMPHLTLDLEDAFRSTVVAGFIDGYARGTTPNPCVLCNGRVRIDAMLELGERLGATALATGHYARLADDGEGPLLAAPADHAKDQTYMLSGLGQETLRRMRFPLSGLTKSRVRELASDAGLAVASKAESQDLCFLAGEGKRAFLARHGGIGERAGEIVDPGGEVLGLHRGHHEFTVGQRRGLGIGGPDPLYVLGTDAERNRVVVGSREELATDRVRVRDATLHRPGGRVDRVRLRYHAKPITCELEAVEAGRHDALEIALGEPAYGVAPGQTACLMDGDLVVGRATIAA